MTLNFIALALFSLCVSEVSCLYIANSSSLTCNQMVECEIKINNCIYKEWLKPQDFTPTSPEGLKVHVDVRKDENGDLVPVIVAEWKARDDGSIIHLTGTEFLVAKQGSGEHFCVHYIFLKKIEKMRNVYGEQWTFILDKVVVDPGNSYLVSVSNLPKPNIAHTNYNINKTIAVPGCKSPAMQPTRMCIERGENWYPNISMVKSGPQNRTLFVTFDTDEHSELYNVYVNCQQHKETQNLSKKNRSSLSAKFDLEAWPHTCCSFTAQIQPFFKCGNDCIRKAKSFNICLDPPKPPKGVENLWKAFTGLFVLLCALCAICAICLRYRKQQKVTGPAKAPPRELPSSELPGAERSVLIIYSRDHPKYTDIVLKLCAFLRAKCGTEVYLDLLDTASIGAMGRLPWTELQKRRIEQSSDKVLILCSRGVQAKWGAMCGGPRVLLREDVCSPMGDMLTLALQLITPDIQRPASYGKYLVAYFEDINDEYDVPSMFDVAVKYKLMKHFEELFFRILDLEKYQKGKVHTIKGIGIDDYIECPSGKALSDAIETFQAYQLENPDWFEKECLDSEDEVPQGESSPFLGISHTPVLKCDPVINIGPSVCKCEVEIHNVDQTHSVWSTEISDLNLEFEEPSILHIQPAQVYSLHPAVEDPLGIYKAAVYHADSEMQPCLLVEPALQGPLPSSRNEVFVNRGPPPEDSPALDKEEALKRLLNLQVSLVSVDIAAPPPSVNDQFQTSWEMHSSQPVEMDESQVEEASGKRQSRWSDQGYSSRDSMIREEPPPSSLAALAKLQEALYINSPISSGFCTETMES